MVPGSQLPRDLIRAPRDRGECCEVHHVALLVPIDRDRVGGGLGHERAEQVWSPDHTDRLGHSDSHFFRPGEGLLGSRRLNRGPSRCARSAGCAGPDVLRDEQVQRRRSTDPAVLVALRARSGRGEAQLDQDLCEVRKDMRMCSDIEGYIAVVCRPHRREVPLGAEQMNHLSADEAPAGREDFGDFEQAQPGLALGLRKSLQDHTHGEPRPISASTRPSSLGPS